MAISPHMRYFSGDARLKYDLYRKSVGERLQRARRRAGLSVKEVTAATGLTGAFISRIENGYLDGRRKWCDVFHLFVMGDLYGVSVSYILGDEDKRGANQNIAQKIKTLPVEIQNHIMGLIDEFHRTLPLHKEVIIHVERPTDICDK